MVWDFIHDLKRGYFLLWDAVERKEQGLPLSEKQKEALAELFYFDDFDDYE